MKDMIIMWHSLEEWMMVFIWIPANEHDVLMALGHSSQLQCKNRRSFIHSFIQALYSPLRPRRVIFTNTQDRQL